MRDPQLGCIVLSTRDEQLPLAVILAAFKIFSKTLVLWPESKLLICSFWPGSRSI